MAKYIPINVIEDISESEILEIRRNLQEISKNPIRTSDAFWASRYQPKSKWSQIKKIFGFWKPGKPEDFVETIITGESLRPKFSTEPRLVYFSGATMYDLEDEADRLEEQGGITPVLLEQLVFLAEQKLLHVKDIIKRHKEKISGN